MCVSDKIMSCFPDRIREKLSMYSSVNEIRLRKNAPLCLTIGKDNIVTNYIVDASEIEFALNSFCKNSVHTYFDDIKNGFIPFDEGCRIGVCGRAVTEGGKVINISEISSLNIRIPSIFPTIPSELIKNINIQNSLLIYSPPGFGKTTLLREIIRIYSSPPYNKRITVIDSRNELIIDRQHNQLSADVLSGYPKTHAIDIAVRVMSPEIIICDEIGLNDETQALLECKNCGIILVCTAHAKNICELLSRNNISQLHKAKIFGGYLGITISNGQRVYQYQRLEDL